MKHQILCPRCEGSGEATQHPDHHAATCGWCHGFGKLIEAERVCSHCLPTETECLHCHGTHRQIVIYPAHSRFELSLLPAENLEE